MTQIPVTIENLSSLPRPAVAPIDIVVPWSGAIEDGTCELVYGTRRGVVVLGKAHAFGTRWVHVQDFAMNAAERVEAIIDTAIVPQRPVAVFPLDPVSLTSLADIRLEVAGFGLFAPTEWFTYNDEEGEGRRTHYGYGRVQDSSGHSAACKVWIRRWPHSPRIDFFLRVVWSDRSPDQSLASFGPITLSVPESYRLHVDFNTHRGGGAEFVQGGRRKILLHAALSPFGDGQMLRWNGCIMPASAGAAHQAEWAARIVDQGNFDGPIVAQADPTVLAPTFPWGIRPTLHPTLDRGDGGRTEALLRWYRYRAEYSGFSGKPIHQWGGLNSPPASGSSGFWADHAHGITHTPLAVAGGSPRCQREFLWTVTKLALRACHHMRVGDTHQPILWNDFPQGANPYHSRWSVWFQRTHSPAQSPEQLGKTASGRPFDTCRPPNDSVRIEGFPFSHISHNHLAALDRLGGDPITREMLEAYSAHYRFGRCLDPNKIGTYGPDQVRSARSEQAMAEAWYSVQDDGPIDHWVQRVKNTLPGVCPYEWFWKQVANGGGEFAITQWFRRDEWQNREAWAAWQTGVSVGFWMCYAIARRIGHADADEALLFCYYHFKTWVNYGWFQPGQPFTQSTEFTEEEDDDGNLHPVAVAGSEEVVEPAPGAALWRAVSEMVIYQWHETNPSGRAPPVSWYTNERTASNPSGTVTYATSYDHAHTGAMRVAIACFEDALARLFPSSHAEYGKAHAVLARAKLILAQLLSAYENFDFRNNNGLRNTALDFVWTTGQQAAVQPLSALALTPTFGGGSLVASGTATLPGGGLALKPVFQSGTLVASGPGQTLLGDGVSLFAPGDVAFGGGSLVPGPASLEGAGAELEPVFGGGWLVQGNIRIDAEILELAPVFGGGSLVAAPATLDGEGVALEPVFGGGRLVYGTDIPGDGLELSDAVFGGGQLVATGDAILNGEGVVLTLLPSAGTFILKGSIPVQLTLRGRWSAAREDQPLKVYTGDDVRILLQVYEPDGKTRMDLSNATNVEFRAITEDGELLDKWLGNGITKTADGDLLIVLDAGDTAGKSAVDGTWEVDVVLVGERSTVVHSPFYRRASIIEGAAT